MEKSQFFLFNWRRKNIYLVSIIAQLLINSITLAQNRIEDVNGFKYAFVGVLKYQDGQIDSYGVTSYLKNELTKKGIIILGEDYESWPKETKINPCLVGRWFASHSPGGIPNSAKADLLIKNCKDEIVYQEESFSTSFGAYYPKNVTLAIKKTLKSIISINYKFNENLTPQIKFPNVELTSETELSLKSYYDINKIETIEGIYKAYQENETTVHYKIGIKKKEDKYIAIIIESELNQWKTGEVKAYFEETSIENIFSTTWLQGNKTKIETFSKVESSSILSIELDDSQTKEKKTLKFLKLYPKISNPSSILPSYSNELKATGSGFAVSSQGVIATNAHVISGGNKFEISLSNELGNFTYQAKILLKDVNNDIAILKIDDPSFKDFGELPYVIDEKTEIGESVFTIGYPLSSIMGNNYKVTNGIVSANTGIEDDIRFLQISVPIQAGNSGGPLFDKAGNVVGLTTAKLNPKTIETSIENVNYAIKSSYLLNVLKMLPDISLGTNKSQLRDKDLKDQIKILKNYVYQIKVY